MQNLSEFPNVGKNLTGSGTTRTVPPTTAPSPSATPLGTPTSTPSGSTTPPSPSLEALLAQVNQAFADLQAAYTSGDPAKVGVAEARLKALVAQYERLRTTPPSAPAPSASATPR